VVRPGDIFWLDADEITQARRLPWADWTVCPVDLKQFKYWRDLQGKEVIVKGYSFRHLGKVVVHPVGTSRSGPGLVVPPEFLIPVLEILDDGDDELHCVCDILLLMSVGCQCGVFKKEQALKNKTPTKKERSNEVFNPW